VKEDVVMKLLRQVKSGEISVEDARVALEGTVLTIEEFDAAVDHGVFNQPESGTVVRASVSPFGDSILIILLSLWGVVWSLYWAGGLAYGLFNGWDQQLLSFNFGMLMLTIIILGMVYLKFVMPDVVIVKHRGNKYITSNDPDGWRQYEV
jgi:hypothetical protein|tara:strand:+ start:58 stop:507 length:450 start_codon:yes stop_codon:yes gene_type:complete